MANYIKSFRDGVLTASDGSGPARTHEVVLAEGDLSIKETHQRVELRNRGVLYDIKEGDQAPLEVSFTLKHASLEPIPQAESVLSSGINNTDTTIPVTAPVSLGFTAPGKGVVSNPAIERTEVISWTGVSTGQLTGATRGEDGTSAAFWVTGNRITQLQADQLTQLYSFLRFVEESYGNVSTRDGLTQVPCVDLVFDLVGVGGSTEETVALEDFYVEDIELTEGADYNTLKVSGRAWRTAVTVS